MFGAYSKDLRNLAKACAKDLHIEDFVKEGVYFHVAGPVYETAATGLMMRGLGCDTFSKSVYPLYPNKANVSLGRHQYLPSYWLTPSRAERIHASTAQRLIFSCFKRKLITP